METVKVLVGDDHDVVREGIRMVLPSEPEREAVGTAPSGEEAIDKVRELARILTRYQYASRLLLIPFATVQQTIVAAAPAPLRVVLYRRFMVRIAEALAARHRAKALVTGESLGQVASQTLDNMAVIDEAARGPLVEQVGESDDRVERRRVGGRGQKWRGTTQKSRSAARVLGRGRLAVGMASRRRAA